MAKLKIDIEDLVVWALVKQAARVSGRGFADEFRKLSGGSVSNAGAIEAFLSIGGVRIQGGGANDRRTPVDALTVSAAIDRLPVEAAMLIVMSARTGIAIDWGEEGVGHYEPVFNRKGKHRRRYADPHNGRDLRGLEGWEWQWVGLWPDQVDAERMLYLTWWHGLVRLRVELEGQLQQWEATGPIRPAEPWDIPKSPGIVLASRDG